MLPVSGKQAKKRFWLEQEQGWKSYAADCKASAEPADPFFWSTLFQQTHQALLGEAVCIIALCHNRLTLVNMKCKGKATHH